MRLQRGVVTSTSPLRVRLHGETAAGAAARLASYTPAVNGLVWVLVDAAGLRLVLGGAP